MVSLAKILPPAEFKAALDLPGLRSWDVKSAERINQFIWAQADTKQILIAGLLGSYYPEEKYEALKYLLGQRDGKALITHNVATIFNDQLNVGSQYRALITALGYQLEFNNGQLDIKALAL